LSYVNTVIGARTNRESALGAFAAGLIGKTPQYGLHIKENRRGKVQVNVETDLKSCSDFSALGYCIGEKVGGKIPVFKMSRGSKPKNSDLNALCASLAVSGSVPMCHVVGETPEASSMKEAFGEENPEEKISFEEKDRRNVFERLGGQKTGEKVDLAILGCPHYWFEQIVDAARLLKGKKVHEDVDLWICTSTPLMTVAKRNGYLDMIEASGAKLVCSYCPAVSKNFFGWEKIATDSTKQAFYCSGILNVDPFFGTTKEVIDAAIKGRWS
jgi:predicted aconitase